MENVNNASRDNSERNLWELISNHRVLSGKVDGLEGRVVEREESGERLRSELTAHIVSMAEKYGRLDERLSNVLTETKSTKRLLITLLVGFAMAVVAGVIGLILKR